MNKVILMGRLTRDPDVMYSSGENSLSIARYTLAVDRRFKRDGDQTADFINCVAWRNTAEFISKYFRKGNAIGVDGSIQTRKYTDKNGNNRTATEVLINNAFFVESKTSQGGSQSTTQAFAEPVSETIDGFAELGNDDDLPF